MHLALVIGIALQGGIAGTVVDAAGAPAAGVRVILGEFGRATLFYNTAEEMFVGTPGLSESDAQRYSALLSTDAAGAFAADGLAAGEYSLIAADPARGVAWTSQKLEAGGRLVVRLALQQPAFVAGSVEGLAFDPTVDVLELKPRSATGNISWVPRLAQEPGSWSFRSTALPAVREWKLVGTHVVLEQDFRATWFSVPVDAEAGREIPVKLDLTSGAPVMGRVVDADGAPVRNVSVVAVLAADAARELGALTDADGRWRIRGLSAGEWRLEALRYGVRELPGCGNGPQELFGSRAFTSDGASEQELELRVSRSRAPPRVGAPAPAFKAQLIDGAELELGALRGKVVLLDFWATWCGMCRADFPRLLATYEAFAPSARFEIVGVSIDEDAALVRRFVASRGLAWPQTALGVTAKNPLAQLYNVNSTPSTVLIAADGTVAALNLTGEPLRKKIEQLLAAK